MQDIVKKYTSKIEKELIGIYDSGPNLLVDPIKHVFSGKGKRIRPLLTLFTSKTLGYDIEKALDAAISIEVLHNFTLVHDDIMDKDKLRHGKETVNVKWDSDIALLAGDAMLALALKKLNTYSKNHLLFPTFINGLLSVCEGQALDKEFEGKDNVSIPEYLNMIDLKTGYLIGLSAELGSIITESNDQETILLRDFGRKIGRSFQIQDDVLEIFSDSKTMGKSLKSDLLLGKKTFLMVKAENHSPGFIKEAKKMILNNYSNGISSIRQELVEKHIYEEAEDMVKTNLDDANQILNELKYDAKYLRYFCRLIGNRKF